MEGANEIAIEQALLAFIQEHSAELGWALADAHEEVTDVNSEDLEINQARTFKAAGVMTTNRGVVITLANRREIQLQING
jgi:hypothetical protein